MKTEVLWLPRLKRLVTRCSNDEYVIELYWERIIRRYIVEYDDNFEVEFLRFEDFEEAREMFRSFLERASL